MSLTKGLIRTYTTMTGNLKIILFMGSVREGRMCERVTKLVHRNLEKRGCFDVETFDPAVMTFEMLKKPLHFYADQSQAPEWLRTANEKIQNADAFVVLTPEYNCTIPPILSNMLDHFSPASYKRKPTGIVTYSVSNLGGARAAVALRPFLSELGTPSIPSSVIISTVNTTVSADGHTENENLQGRIDSLMDDLQFYATALKNQRLTEGQRL